MQYFVGSWKLGLVIQKKIQTSTSSNFQYINAYAVFCWKLEVGRVEGGRKIQIQHIIVELGANVGRAVRYLR